MTGDRAEQVVATTMRLLAAAFAITGILFISTPDGVIRAIEDVGAGLGDFAPAPASEQMLWLGLGFAYMVVITGLALVVQADVARFRPLLLVLAAGKAASSVAAGAFFALDADVFTYLVNFAVDGVLVAVALWCWALAGRVEASAPATTAGGAAPAAARDDAGGVTERSPAEGARPA